MAQSTASLTDSQIAHIAYTAGQIDIGAADLALKKTSNNAVKALANETVRDHTAANQKALALFDKLKVKPEDGKAFDLARDIASFAASTIASKKRELEKQRT
jgi:putative membrane protein